MEPLTLKLLLGGDLMLGRGIDQQMPQHCDPALHEAVVRDARHYAQLRRADSWSHRRALSAHNSVGPEPGLDGAVQP